MSNSSTLKPLSRKDPRRRGELILVQSLMNKVQVAAISVMADRGVSGAAASAAAAPGTTDLTETEKSVFNKYTYYGWAYGVPAGGAVFAVLFGGLRLAAYRRFLRARALPSSATYHARTTTSRQQYTALDRQGMKQQQQASVQNVPTSTSATTTTTSATVAKDSFEIFANETVVQVQFMVSVAVSLLVGTLTCNFTTDRQLFHRDLSVLPLQSGTSVLCHRMCPQLIQQRNTLLLEMQSLRPLYEQHLIEKQQQKDESATPQDEKNSERPSPFVQAVLQLNPKELWEDPVTEELESMKQLVQNCQYRMDFEDECRRRKHRVIDSTGLVDVPKPGVPMRYHKSNVGSDAS